MTREIAGDAALLVPPDDAAAIAAAMVSLRRDEAKRRELIAAGRARAARFDLARMADDTLAVYRRVAEGASR